MMHNGSGISQFAQRSDQNKHFFMFFLIFSSWKIAIFSGSSFYMAERHFSHLVYHLPIGCKHIFHLVLTFVSFCPYRFSTHFSHHSLEITLLLLTKTISQPPENEFREVKQNLSNWLLVSEPGKKRKWAVLVALCSKFRNSTTILHHFSSRIDPGSLTRS